MEPERRLRDEVHERRQIVAAADVDDFMRKDCVDLLERQMPFQPCRPDERLNEKTDDAGLERAGGDDNASRS